MTVALNPGDIPDAPYLNKMFSRAGLTKFNATYNNDGTINTLVDTMVTPNITYTFTYNADGTWKSVTDGTNTWTFTYDQNGNCTGSVES